MLTYAFDLLYAIYEEQGYQATDIPRLILTNNLYGVEIDPRAGALAAFALTMKAREKYRRFLSVGKAVQPNICVLENIKVDPQELDDYMDKVGRDLFSGGLQGVVNQWEEADNFGSLIRPLVSDVSDVLELLRERQMDEDLFMASVHQQVLKALRQADFLSPKYHVVVANPPYTGFKNMNPSLKAFAESNYEDSSSDLYAMFIARLIDIAPAGRLVSMVTMDSWMYGDEYNEFRERLLEQNRILSLVHLGPHAFDEISGEVVQVAAFVIKTTPNAAIEGVFVDLVKYSNSTEKQVALVEGRYRTAKTTDWFSVFPRKVLMGYRATDHTREAFVSGTPLQEYAEAFTGLQTGDNPLFIKYWFETSVAAIAFGCQTREAAQETGKKWFPYIKGSEYRKWYGNQIAIVDWKSDGKEIREHRSSTVRNSDYYFQNGLAYNNISKDFCARYVERGFIFDQKNSMFFSSTDSDLLFALGFLHSTVITPFLQILSPKDFNPGSLKVIPVRQEAAHTFTPKGTVTRLIEITREDWNRSEISWEFTSLELTNDGRIGSLRSIYRELRQNWRAECDEVIALEKRNDAFFIRAYGLQDEIVSNVSIKKVTLFVNPQRRYGSDKSESELEALLLADTMREFISYAVGCMLGRYSLDKPGLILANQGETTDDYLLKVSNQTEPLNEDRAISEPDSVVFVSGAAVACFSCGDTVPTDEAAFVISEYEQGATPLRGRPLIYCSNCAEGPQASNVTRQQPLAKFSVRQALDRKWCEPDTLKKFISMAGCFGHRVPADPDKISFLRDDDNVIPLLDGDWFTDDISQRFREFLKVTFGTEHYDENLTFLENALYPDNLTGRKRKTIRDYFLKEFYNHHVKLYKKRPIYWLFSSPKGTFNALIYMHRYRPDTVSVVLSYLRDFRDKLTHHTAHLQSVADRADGSKSDKTKALKQINEFKKQLKELDDYERTTLFPLAQKQIPIDLDDGVKVNYPKFGAALKKIPGLEKVEA